MGVGFRNRLNDDRQLSNAMKIAGIVLVVFLLAGCKSVTGGLT